MEAHDEARLVDLLQMCNVTIGHLEERAAHHMLLTEVKQLRRETLDRIEVERVVDDAAAALPTP